MKFGKKKIEIGKKKRRFGKKKSKLCRNKAKGEEKNRLHWNKMELVLKVDTDN